MSSLRRRTSNSGIQWLIIGVILGLGCASVVGVAGLVLQVIQFSGSVALLPTPTVGPTSTPVVVTSVVVITATSAPATAAANTAAISPTVAATQQIAATVTPYVIAPVSSQSPNQTVATADTSGNIQSTSQPTVTSAVVEFPTTGPASGSQAATQSAVGPTGNGANVTQPATGATLLPSLIPTELIPIGGGTFQMGTTSAEANAAVTQCVGTDKGQCALSDAEDSIPSHQVTVNAFQIERYDVSFTQYLTFLNSLPSSYKNGCDGQLCAATNAEDKNSPIKLDGVTFQLTNSLFANNPATFITWYGADAYCKAIGRRLPTEAEWERTARAAPGTQADTRPYPWGNNWDPANANTSRPSQGFTRPVDSYPTGQSADGVYNLSGNAGQWVNDWYDAAYYKSADTKRFLNPTGPSSGQTKVIRGGGWDEVPFFARVVQRQSLEPGKTRSDIGFRCAADSSGDSAALPGSSSGTANQTTTGTAQAAVTPTVTTLKP